MPDNPLYKWAVENIALGICSRMNKYEKYTCLERQPGEPSKYCAQCRCKWVMEEAKK